VFFVINEPRGLIPCLTKAFVLLIFTIFLYFVVLYVGNHKNLRERLRLGNLSTQTKNNVLVLPSRINECECKFCIKKRLRFRQLINTDLN